jgi:hypothetical protein
MRSLAALVAVLALAAAWLAGAAQEGAVRLEFSGRVTGGSCQELDSHTIRCRVEAGNTVTLSLSALVLPPIHPVTITAVSLPGWVTFQAVGGTGQAATTRHITPPPQAGGRVYTLRFRATTAYGLATELTVILEVVSKGQGPSTEHRTGPEGEFRIPAPGLENTSVHGWLRDCGGGALAGVPVSVELIPRPGRTITRVGDVAGVTITVPGYAPLVVREIRLLSSLDLAGHTQTTIELGTRCLERAAPPTGVAGSTDALGRFRVNLPWPGTSVSGRLVDPAGAPLPVTEFRIVPLSRDGSQAGSPDEIAGFSLEIPGREPVRLTRFIKLGLPGVVLFDLGDVTSGEEADLLPWSKDRPLTWDDFRGQPPEAPSGEAAYIRYRLEVRDAVPVLKWDPATKSWEARLDPQKLRVLNLMVRSLSWVDPARKTDHLLAHEQGHFDLAEVYRRILEKRLLALRARGATQKQAVAALMKAVEAAQNAVWEKLEEVQNRYDGETGHGANPEKQSEWLDKIKLWLRNPGAAPQPAG